MIRLILRLLGIHDFEVCQSCETLKQQLIIANEEQRRLTDTLISIVSPKVTEAAPVEINQVASSSALFSRRRAALEARDRAEAQIIQQSKHLGKPDDKIREVTPTPIKDLSNSVENLEKELGVEEAVKNG